MTRRSPRFGLTRKLMVAAAAVLGLGWVSAIASAVVGPGAGPQCNAGLLENWSFENGIQGWKLTAGSSASAGRPTGFTSAEGANVGYVRGWVGGATMYQEVPAVPGGLYSLSGFGGTHQPTFVHELALVFIDSTGTQRTELTVDMNHDVDTEHTVAPYSHGPVAAPAWAALVRAEVRADGDWTKIDAVCMLGPDSLAPTTTSVATTSTVAPTTTPTVTSTSTTPSTTTAPAPTTTAPAPTTTAPAPTTTTPAPTTTAPAPTTTAPAPVIPPDMPPT